MKVNEKPALLLQLDRVAITLASLLLVATALSAPLFVGISGMRTTGCPGTCDYALVGVGGAVIIYGLLATVVLVTLGLLLLLLHRPDRFLWWLPCSGLIAAGVIVLVGNHLIDLGVAG